MPFNGVIPATRPEKAPFGLFSAASVVERGPRDEHWGQGFDAMSEACSFDASVVDVCGAVPAADVLSADGPRWVTVRPFGILAKDECLTVGINAEDRKARVVRQLEMVTEKAVEKELWSGTYRSGWDAFREDEEPGSSIPMGYLSEASTPVVHGTAVKPQIALALLEQAHADCSPGTVATVHMSPLVAEMIGQHLTEDGGKLYTHQGNLVSVGTGYDGSGPGQAPPADKFTHWLYVTGQVFVVLGSKELVTISEAQATDSRTNETTFVAERPAAVYTDGCCQFAAKADVRL